MKKILFVCMGNICRSPAAEGIMKKLILQNGLDEELYVDSAGTIDYHEGELPDKRMINHAFKRGYVLNSRARKFNPKTDFSEFDYIVSMDDENFNSLISFDIDKKYLNKIFKMTSFCRKIKVKEVPDPYYNGGSGFEFVLDILEEGTKGLLKKIKDDLERTNNK